ncbi:putative non-specific serine/threonine protein kinase [Medicago truncatula]|uniref:Putative non-specific serine/threonine protein kinase n=1 Tax=Medicago truncatula TaxID=3880 RepID=A0A396HHV4_MEDTR|nr:putative non-specific serine/threonine protein kinase [Medicago truncatula]
MLYQNRLKNNVTSKVQISDSDLKSSPSKSGKHNIIVEENIRIHKEAENEAWKQNVLLTKERSLCAKLSDMGISKLVLEDMSSLVHSSTGEYKSLCFSALAITD